VVDGFVHSIPGGGGRIVSGGADAREVFMPGGGGRIGMGVPAMNAREVFIPGGGGRIGMGVPCTNAREVFLAVDGVDGLPDGDDGGMASREEPRDAAVFNPGDGDRAHPDFGSSTLSWVEELSVEEGRLCGHKDDSA